MRFGTAGMVWLRKFGFCQVRSGKAGQARSGKVWCGRVTPGWAGYGVVRQVWNDPARFGVARFGTVG